MKTKICRECGLEFPANYEYFYKHEGCKQGLRPDCKKCWKIKHKNIQKRWREKNKEHERDYHLRRKYGISTQEFNDLLKKQDNRCALCGIHMKDLNQNLCVDHNHKTGKIRGLLCRTCNRALGLFKDNFFIFIKITKYLSD